MLFVFFCLIILALSFVLDAVGQVDKDETPESLWGDDKTTPRDALEANGFQMRQVYLTRTGRNR